MHNGDNNSKRSHDWQRMPYSAHSECNEARVESLPIPRTAHKHIAFNSLVSVRLKLGVPSIRIGANKNQFRLRDVISMWVWHKFFHASILRVWKWSKATRARWHAPTAVSMVAVIWFVFHSKFSEPQRNRTRVRKFHGDLFIRRVTYVVKCMSSTQNDSATSKKQKQTKTLHVN